MNEATSMNTATSQILTMLAEICQIAHMTDFSLDISKLKQERLKAYLFNVGVLSIPIIYDVVIPNSFIKSGYYFFVASFLLVNGVKELLAEKTFRVSFDEINRQIILVSKAWLSKPKRKAIHFHDARLEYIEEGSFLIFKGNLRLCFMIGKMEVACIKEATRGFSKETLNEIVEKAKECNIPSTTL